MAQNENEFKVEITALIKELKATKAVLQEFSKKNPVSLIVEELTVIKSVLNKFSKDNPLSMKVESLSIDKKTLNDFQKNNKLSLDVDLANLKTDPKDIARLQAELNKGLSIDIAKVIPTSFGNAVGKKMAASFFGEVGKQLKAAQNLDFSKFQTMLNAQLAIKLQEQSVKQADKLEYLEVKKKNYKEMVDYRSKVYMDNYYKKVRYGRGYYASPMGWAARNIFDIVKEAGQDYKSKSWLSAANIFRSNSKLNAVIAGKNPFTKLADLEQNILGPRRETHLQQIGKNFGVDVGTDTTKYLTTEELKTKIYNAFQVAKWSFLANPLKIKTIVKEFRDKFKDVRWDVRADDKGISDTEKKTSLWNWSKRASVVNRIVGIKQMFSQIAIGVGPILKRLALGAVGSLIKGIFSLYMTGVKMYAGVMKKLVKVVFSPAKSLVKLFTSFLKRAVSQSQIVQAILEMTVVPFILMLEYTLLPVLKAVSPVVTKMVKTVASHTKDLMKIGDVFANIIKMFTSDDGMFNGAFNIFNQLKDGSKIWTNPVAGLFDIGKTILNGIATYITTNSGTIKPMIEDALMSLIGMLQASVNVASSIANMLIDCIRAIVRTPEFANLVSSVIDVITSIINAVSTLAAEPAIQDALKKLLYALFTGPINVVRSAESGIDVTTPEGDKAWWLRAPDKFRSILAGPILTDLLGLIEPSDYYVDLAKGNISDEDLSKRWLQKMYGIPFAMLNKIPLNPVNLIGTNYNFIKWLGELFSGGNTTTTNNNNNNNTVNYQISNPTPITNTTAMNNGFPTS